MIIQNAPSRFHVETPAEFERLVQRLRKSLGTSEEFGMDFETHGPNIVGPNGKSKPDALRHLPVGVSFAWGDGERIYIPFPQHPDWHRVVKVVADPRARVLCHNVKYEYQICLNMGITPRASFLDSMVYAYCAGWKLEGKGGLRLKALAAAYLGYRGPDFETVMAGRDIREVPVEELAPYAANDAYLTLALGQKARNECERLDSEGGHVELEHRVIPVTAHMERTGVAIDRAYLLSAAAQCEAEMVEIAAAFTELTTTDVMMPVKVKRQKMCSTCYTPAPPVDCGNPRCMGGSLFRKNGKPHMEAVLEDHSVRLGAEIGSDAQVARWLFDELAWWPKPDLRDKAAWTKEGRPSTGAEVITRYAAMPGKGGEACRLRLRYQALRKYASTYTRTLIDLAAQSHDGRLHTSYNQVGTDTSRYSSSLPNISNIPQSDRQDVPWLKGLPDIRSAFVTREGWSLVIRDYSQIELRLMAHFSRDPLLLAAYVDGSVDLHQRTADAVGCDRKSAKIINFSTLYRISAKRLAIKQALASNDWESHSRGSAQVAIDSFMDLYPGVPRYHERAIEYARTHGHARTLTGFRRPLKKWSRDDKWGTENKAVNTPIQGSAGGIIKLALAELYDLWSSQGHLEVDTNIVGQTYDEIIVECRDDRIAEVTVDMHRVMVAVGQQLNLRVPLATSGGSGKSWSEAK